jgi:hypothetical protein
MADKSKDEEDSQEDSQDGVKKAKVTLLVSMSDLKLKENFPKPNKIWKVKARGEFMPILDDGEGGC